MGVDVGSIFFSVSTVERASLDKVIGIINDAIAPKGFECLEAEWLGNARILRIFVDRPGLGIDLSGCVEVNSLLYNNSPLDSAVPGTYQLEVSSPGIERPLRLREHFEKHMGEVVEVKLLEKQMERRNGIGKILAVNDQVTLATAQGTWVFDLDKLQKAHLVYDWESSKETRN